MRLIDADNLIKLTQKDMEFAFNNGFLDMAFEREHLIKVIRNQPTAYSVDEVVEELEKELSLADKEKERCVGENNLQFDSAKGYASGISTAIEIVKHGCVTDDVCEWKAIGANDNWSTSCDKNSTHNVFGVAWFKRCPYCGRKL